MKWRRRIQADRFRPATAFERFTAIGFLLLAFGYLPGCGEDSGARPPLTGPGEGPGGNTPTWTADVGPIIHGGCTCHQPGGIMFATAPLDTYEHVIARKEKVKQRAGVEGSMPPTGPLPQSQRQTIIAWVDGGAPR